MKQKIILLTILLVGITISLNAQVVATPPPATGENIESLLENIERTRARTISRTDADPRVVNLNGVEVLGFPMSNEQRVSLNLSKNFNGESISSEADFDVSEGQQAISLNLSGSCDEGEIILTIKQPNGNTMKSQKITNAANISWSASIPISEENKKEFVGKWKLEIKTNKAKGRYSLNISSR